MFLLLLSAELPSSLLEERESDDGDVEEPDFQADDDSGMLASPSWAPHLWYFASSCHRHWWVWTHSCFLIDELSARRDRRQISSQWEMSGGEVQVVGGGGTVLVIDEKARKGSHRTWTRRRSHWSYTVLNAIIHLYSTDSDYCNILSLFLQHSWHWTNKMVGNWLNLNQESTVR